MKGLSATLVMAMTAVALFAVVCYGVVMYNAQVDAAHEKLTAVTSAALYPVAFFSANAVAGNNNMILKSSQSSAIYDASTAQFIVIKGISDARDATDFAPAVAPQQVYYDWKRPDDPEADSALQFALRFGSSDDRARLDIEAGFYALRIPIKVKNGGEVIGIFSADSLKGIGLKAVKKVALVTLIVLAVSIILAGVMGGIITKPIVATAGGISNVAETLDLRATVETTATNEIGDMVGSFNELIERLRNVVGSVGGKVDQISGAIVSLHKVSEELSETSTEERRVILSTAESVTDMTRNIGDMVEASAEMKNASDSIAKLIHDVTDAARQAVNVAEGTAATVTELDDNSRKIDDVLRVISGIADQTNLLALNATIEAARAGESGKGFAVVANEVKELAKETADATGSIFGSIEAIKTSTAAAISAIEEIHKMIGMIAEMQVHIGAAVEQQAAASSNIGQSATHSKESVEAIAATMRSVEELSERNNAVSQSILSSAGELESTGSDLRNAISVFSA